MISKTTRSGPLLLTAAAILVASCQTPLPSHVPSARVPMERNAPGATNAGGFKLLGTEAATVVLVSDGSWQALDDSTRLPVGPAVVVQGDPAKGSIPDAQWIWDTADLQGDNDLATLKKVVVLPSNATNITAWIDAKYDGAGHVAVNGTDYGGLPDSHPITNFQPGENDVRLFGDDWCNPLMNVGIYKPIYEKCEQYSGVTARITITYTTTEISPSPSPTPTDDGGGGGAAIPPIVLLANNLAVRYGLGAVLARLGPVDAQAFVTAVKAAEVINIILSDALPPASLGGKNSSAIITKVGNPGFRGAVADIERITTTMGKDLSAIKTRHEVVDGAIQSVKTISVHDAQGGEFATIIARSKSLDGAPTLEIQFKSHNQAFLDIVNGVSATFGGPQYGGRIKIRYPE